MKVFHTDKYSNINAMFNDKWKNHILAGYMNHNLMIEENVLSLSKTSAKLAHYNHVLAPVYHNSYTLCYKHQNGITVLELENLALNTKFLLENKTIVHEKSL